MRRVLVVGGLALVLVVANWLILDKERLVAGGRPILLELAPVDPRSLIQGDYMALDYAIAREIRDIGRQWPRTGTIVVTLDSLGVARYVRPHRDSIPLREGERLLRYWRDRGRLQIGSNAFHFQEGQASRYARARYGELRASRSGTTVLVALRDSTMAVVGGPLAPQQ